MNLRFTPTVALSLAFLGVGASAHPVASSDFTDLSLEELVQVQLTTVARQSLSVWDTPAAASAITGREALLAGATDLASVLTLMPGVQVARPDAINTAISIRGFNNETSSKLLLLRDGRNVYNLFYSGALWPLVDIVMEDTNRIEIHRGPAGALWGANAVNGVVNVVSKNAHDTQGTLLSTSVGNHLDYSSSVRHGFKLGQDAAARIYIKSQERDGQGTTTGAASQGSRLWHVGSRFDWDRPAGGGLMAIVEYTGLRTNSQTTKPSLVAPYQETMKSVSRYGSFSMTGRWTHPVGDTGQLALQSSWEEGNSHAWRFGEEHSTFDVDLQLTAHPLPGHDLLVGGTHRSTNDTIENSPWLSFTETADQTQFNGIFIIDTVSLINNRLRLSAGTKFEHNSISGWENQPTVRAHWHHNDTQVFWAGISRAARTPSRAEEGVRYWIGTLPADATSPLPTVVNWVIPKPLPAETATSFELGHRLRWPGGWTIETNLYYTRYDRLRSILRTNDTQNNTGQNTYNTLNLVAENRLRGSSYGGEIQVRWAHDRRTRLVASASSVHIRIDGEQRPTLVAATNDVGRTPTQEYRVQMGRDLTEHLSLDLFLHHQRSMPEIAVPAYTGVDLRLGWKYSPSVEWELIGKDLLDPRHPEFGTGTDGSPPQQLARSVILKATLRF